MFVLGIFAFCTVNVTNDRKYIYWSTVWSLYTSFLGYIVLRYISERKFTEPVFHVIVRPSNTVVVPNLSLDTPHHHQIKKCLAVFQTENELVVTLNSDFLF